MFIKTSSIATLFATASCRQYQLHGVYEFQETIPNKFPSVIDIRIDANQDDTQTELVQIGPHFTQYVEPGVTQLEHSYQLTEPGYQTISIYTVEPSNVEFSGTVTVRNGYGCLNSNEFPKKTLIGFIFIWLTIGTFVCEWQIRKCQLTQPDVIENHHRFLLWLSITATLEFLLHYVSMLYTNLYGVDNFALQMMVIALRTIRDMTFILMMISLSNGFGITFSVISKKKWIAFKKIGTFMLIPSLLCAFNVVTTVDMRESMSIILKVAIVIRMILQFVFCGLMVASLTHMTRRGVNNKRWGNRLEIFKHFLIGIHLLSFCYVCYLICNANGRMDVYRHREWIYRYGIWDVLFVALLNSMMMVWKPNQLKSGYEPVASEQVRQETQDLLMDDEEATYGGADLELGHGI